MSLYDICWKHKISMLDIVSDVNDKRKAGILPKHERVVKDRKKTFTTYNPITNLRTCSKCKELIEWTPENFYYENKRLGRLSCYCKPCKLKINEIYQAQRERREKRRNK